MKYLFLLLFIPSIVLGESELDCMAKNIYFEARGEPEAGQFMVGFITMNRVISPNWPNTICKVVYQKSQFSWTNDTYSNRPFKGKLYNHMVYIASIVMQAKEIEHYGTHFKRFDVKSRYFTKLVKLIKINNHQFYE